MDASALAAALVERLSAIVPSPVTLVAVGNEIEMSGGERKCGRVTMDLSVFGPLPNFVDEKEFLHAACFHVLDTVQDYTAEATTDPWPGTALMPRPMVTVSEDAINLWYQTAGEVVLALPPIARV